eukprot:6455968-Amphidinium_carterae.1
MSLIPDPWRTGRVESRKPSNHWILKSFQPELAVSIRYSVLLMMMKKKMMMMMMMMSAALGSSPRYYIT